MIKKINQLIKKFCTREIIAYLVAGVLTTIVNIVTYHLCCDILRIENLLANAIAWVLSVLFAYVVNDKFVFIQEKMTPKEEFMKMTKFFGARLFSFFIDEGGMFLLVDLLKVNNLLSKIVMNVIVIVINYVLSKLFIFQTKESKNGNREEVYDQSVTGEFRAVSEKTD
jgi:Predicted membrane protein